MFDMDAGKKVLVEGAFSTECLVNAGAGSSSVLSFSWMLES